MSKKPSDPDFRAEIAAKFKDAIRNQKLTKKAAAQDLQVTRQSLYLYTKAKVLPSPEVIRRAMDLWKIDLTYRDRRLTLEDLSQPEQNRLAVVPIQMTLWDVIKRLDNQSVKVEIKDKDLDLLELKVSINFRS
jgi:DNA-binding XRE family transcriptional regulator